MFFLFNPETMVKALTDAFYPPAAQDLSVISAPIKAPLQLTQHDDMLAELIFSLETAAANEYVRKSILDHVNRFAKDLNISTTDILYDAQLLRIYQWLLIKIRDPEIRKKLFALPIENDPNHWIGCDVVLRRPKDHHLRSVSISRTANRFRIRLLQGKKTVAEKTIKKYAGSSAAVTPSFDITPLEGSALEPPIASKVYHLGPSQNSKPCMHTKTQYHTELRLLKECVSIARRMGHKANIGSIYTHYKMVLDGDTFVPKLCNAVRITEPWLPYTLETLFFNPSILNMDVNYKKAVDRGEDLKFARKVIKHRLMGELLNDAAELYNLDIIHNDLKAPNTQIYADDKGLHVRLADFGNSVKVSSAASAPIACTINDAAPEVISHVLRGLHLHSERTRKEIKDPDTIMFGRELLYKKIGSNGKFVRTHPHHKQDMFSLGLILFIMVTNCYPTEKFNGKTKYGITYMHVQDAYKKYPQYAALLQGLLEYNKDKRFNINEALAVYSLIPEPISLTSSMPTTGPGI